MVVELDGFKELLEVEPKVEPGETAMSTPEQERSSDAETSGDEFYLEGFIRAAKSVRLGALHKPSPKDDTVPRCGQKANGFEFVGADDALERKATFCVKCFGKAGGCDKLCSVVKTKQIDGVKVTSRCSRRCDRGCPRLIGFGDTDGRAHRCHIHEEEGVEEVNA